MHPKRPLNTHQKHARLKIVETQRTLQDLATKYPGRCRLGEEKIWSQGLLERFNVVLTHLRRAQDGTGSIQCIRSMGGLGIKKLEEMVNALSEEDFHNVKAKALAILSPYEDDSQGQPEVPDGSQVESGGKSIGGD